MKTFLSLAKVRQWDKAGYVDARNKTLLSSESEQSRQGSLTCCSHQDGTRSGEPNIPAMSIVSTHVIKAHLDESAKRRSPPLLWLPFLICTPPAKPHETWKVDNRLPPQPSPQKVITNPITVLYSNTIGFKWNSILVASLLRPTFLCVVTYQCICHPSAPC